MDWTLDSGLSGGGGGAAAVWHGHSILTSMLLQSYQGCFTQAPSPRANEGRMVPSASSFIQACLFTVEFTREYGTL